jgi:hypothetical protein
VHLVPGAFDFPNPKFDLVIHGARTPGALACCHPSTIGRHIRPPGLAFGRPGGRLQRHIRYAAASFFFTIAEECRITLFGVQSGDITGCSET